MHTDLLVDLGEQAPRTELVERRQREDRATVGIVARSRSGTTARPTTSTRRSPHGPLTVVTSPIDRPSERIVAVPMAISPGPAGARPSSTASHIGPDRPSRPVAPT